MKICIYGAGAVGGVMAAGLARAGHEGSVGARGANLTAIREKGLRVREAKTGEVLVTRPAADGDPAKLGPPDAVVVAVKAQGLPGVAAALPPLLGADTSSVTAMRSMREHVSLLQLPSTSMKPPSRGMSARGSPMAVLRVTSNVSPSNPRTIVTVKGRARK